jgi:hypothetical protein
VSTFVPRLGPLIAAGAFVAALVPTPAQAQIWGDIRLAGGVTAARRAFDLGAPEGRFDASWLVDFIHRHMMIGNWQPAALDTFERHQTVLQGIRQAASQRPEGLRVPDVRAPKKDIEAFREFLDLIGASAREERERFVAVVQTDRVARERIEWLRQIGIDVPALVATLNRREPAIVTIPEAVLPLPLPLFFEEVVFEPARSPIVSLLRDRSTALAYLGLLNLDDETLTYLAAHPGLTRRLRDETAPAFAAFARAVRVRGGRMDLPGGPSAEPLWRSLVDKSPADPEPFILALFAGDDGRLAYFYDAIDHLDAEHQAFALSARVDDAERLRNGSALYSWFAGIEPTWDVRIRPFSRPTPDPALVLDLIQVLPSGVAGPAWLPGVLKRVSASTGWSSEPQRMLQSLKDEPASALWALWWIFDSPANSEARVRLLSFAQRRFMSVDRTAAPDVEAAVRALREMPALALALERMGVTSPALFARISRGAHALTTGGGMKDALQPLARWQTALALLEQIQLRRQWSEAELDPLLTSLADIGFLRPSAVSDAVAVWLSDVLLPMFVPERTPAAAAETVAVRAFVARPDAPPRSLTWDGLSYVIDERGPVTRDVLAMRAASPTPSIGDLLVLADIRRRLGRGTTTVEAVTQLADDLSALEPAIRSIPAGMAVPADTLSMFDDVVRELRKITKPKDAVRSNRQLPAVTNLFVSMTDAVMTPFVYALAAAPLNQPPAVYADVWRHSTIAPPPADALQPWRDTAWTPAEFEVIPGGGTRLRGSLLSADIALADAHLPRLNEGKLGSSNANTADWAVLVAELVLPPRPSGSDTTASLVRGRQLLASWRKTAPSRSELRATLRDAGVSPLRTNLVSWVMERQPEAVASGLTLMELARLGNESGAPLEIGMPSMPFDGCLCMIPLGHRSSDDYRAYWNAGVSAALSRDLQLWLAEQLMSRGLPLGLMRELLPAATADWLARVAPFAPNDWEALSIGPRQLTDHQIDEYLLLLVKTGHLVPPSGAVR